MSSDGGRSRGLIADALQSIPEENRDADFSATAHGCRAGMVYSEATVGGLTYITVRPCLTCLVESVRARLPERFRGGWESWQSVPQLANLIKLVRKWQGEPWSLLLHGRDGVDNVGAGKTHVACAVALDFAARGIGSMFWNVPELMDALRLSVTEHVPAPSIPHDRLLILDDLCLERETPMVAEQVELLIDRRWRQNSPTIVTTNKSLAHVHETYPRAHSRFAQGYRLEWVAPDYRRR